MFECLYTYVSSGGGSKRSGKKNKRIPDAENDNDGDEYMNMLEDFDDDKHAKKVWNNKSTTLNEPVNKK